MLKDGKRVNREGEVLDIEFLLFSPTFERIVAPFVKNLKQLGIAARIRFVDPSQFQSRLKKFDFRHHHPALHRAAGQLRVSN